MSVHESFEDRLKLVSITAGLLETVNIGRIPQKEVVGSEFSKVSGLDSGVDIPKVCPMFSNFSLSTWNIGKEVEENGEYNRRNEFIFASHWERASDTVETEKDAFKAFVVPEPTKDDYGDGMFDHDTGGDDMDRTGHAPQGGPGQCSLPPSQ